MRTAAVIKKQYSLLKNSDILDTCAVVQRECEVVILLAEGYNVVDLKPRLSKMAGAIGKIPTYYMRRDYKPNS